MKNEYAKEEVEAVLEELRKPWRKPNTDSIICSEAFADAFERLLKKSLESEKNTYLL